VVLAEVYLARDLSETAAKDADQHGGVCGDVRAGDGDLVRLLRRPARKLVAANLAEANEPDRAGQACD
jgi:hypothetical protein